jgi:hypothetical protein
VLRSPAHRVLGPDPDRHRRLVHRLTQQPHEHHLLFEGFENLVQALGEIGNGKVRRPADHDLLFVPLDQAFQDHREDGSGVRPFAGLDPLRKVGDHRRDIGQYPPIEAGVQNSPQLGDGVLFDRRGKLPPALLHPPVSVISTSKQPLAANGTVPHAGSNDLVSEGYWTTATCRVSCASRRTVRMTTSSRS